MSLHFAWYRMLVLLESEIAYCIDCKEPETIQVICLSDNVSSFAVVIQVKYKSTVSDN